MFSQSFIRASESSKVKNISVPSVLDIQTIYCKGKIILFQDDNLAMANNYSSNKYFESISVNV